MKTLAYPLTAEEKLLLTAARPRLSEAHTDELQALIPQITDWQGLVKRAMSTHLSPMLFKSLKSLNSPALPQAVVTALQQSYHSVLATNTRLYAHFIELASAWQAKGVDVIPLKGIYLAEKVYEDIGLRHLSDIDLLLRPEQLDSCMEAAQNIGWQVKELQHHSEQFTQDFGTAHPFKLIKGNTVVELHVHIHSRGKGYQVDIRDYWQRAVPGQLSGQSVMLLNPTDLLQHVCLHLHRHMADTELKISSFCDVREILAHRPDEIDWAYFRESALRYGILQQMQQTLFLCQQYWGVAVPGHFLSQVGKQEKDSANERFVQCFRQGRMDGPAKLDRSLDAGLERLRSTGGTVAAIRHLKDYLFPSGTYLRQRYSAYRGPMLMVKVYHPFSLFRKTISVLFRRLSENVYRIGP